MERKVAVVTGASRGIGEGIARNLAADGYTLVLICRNNEEKLNSLAQDLHDEYGVEILTDCGDVGDETFVAKTASSVKQLLGRVDVLVNNAGVWTNGLTTDTDLHTWNRIIKTNLTGVFLMCRSFIPIMMQEHSGSIINISSIWGVNGASFESVYSASKGGVNAYTQAIAKELAPSGITVNAIAPGVIDTDMNSNLSRDEKSALKESIPLGRFGEPEDIGQMVLSIINSPYMTGQIITVDGGFL